MHLLSRGMFPEECRRDEAMVRSDFAFLFVSVVALTVGTRLLVWFIHGQ